MMELIIGAACGLLAGWFLLPAPKFVTNMWKRMFGQKELIEKK